MVTWFTKSPSWAALSLIVNGLLFGSLLAVWQEQASLAARADSPLDRLPVDELAAHVAVTDTA
ncbi:MAG: hypothetical protein WA947_14670, partial [Phormidesmis sp.]